MLKLKSWLIGKDPDAGKDWRQEEEGDDRGWDGWMASPMRWTWVWVSSGSRWWTGRPGVLQSMRSQRVGHNWATEMTEADGRSNALVLLWRLCLLWSLCCNWKRNHLLSWYHLVTSSSPIPLPQPPWARSTKARGRQRVGGPCLSPGSYPTPHRSCLFKRFPSFPFLLSTSIFNMHWFWRNYLQ